MIGYRLLQARQTLQKLRQKRALRDQSGITALEFAFAAPIAFLMLFAVIEFGRAVFTQGVLLYAAEEATRWGIVNQGATAQQIADYAESKVILAAIANHDEFTVVATPTLNPDQTITVSVVLSVPYEMSLPLGNLAPITLTASSEGFLAPPIN